MLGKVFRHNLDAKNRMRIPAKLRETLDGGYVIIQGTGGCLYVLKKSKAEEMFSPYNNVSLFDAAKRKALREISLSAWEAVEDAQGRILIPEELRRFAGIKKDVVTFDNFGTIEIWGAERLDDETSSANFDETVAVLADLEHKTSL